MKENLNLKNIADGVALPLNTLKQKDNKIPLRKSGIFCGDARIRTWIPGFGDQSLTVGRHPRGLNVLIFIEYIKILILSTPSHICYNQKI